MKPMAGDREMVRHFLAALAYRTQKALRDAPAHFADFNAGAGVRTPHQLVRHMNGVLYYALMVLKTSNLDYRGNLETLPWHDEISRFHETLQHLDQELVSHRHVRHDLLKCLLQGPLADAMTHAGQLGMLRRMSGSPIATENFMKADIETGQVSAVQPEPVSPDE
jgi:hypothetical protein